MSIIGTTGGLTEIEVDELRELIDVVITAPTSGQTLQYDATNSRWINASAATGGGSGTVTSVSAGVGLSASTNPITGSGEISLTNTAVSAGSYTLTTITVNAQGRITAASNGAAGSGTVTSAGVSGNNGITVAGSPITTEGIIVLGLGNITPSNISTGIVSAASVNVTGDVRATTGRVLASAATITAKLTGQAASFSAIVSADAGLNTTTVSAASIGVTGDINAAAGRITASAATVTGKLTGAAAAFSGIVSADAGINTTTVSAASIGVTGDINAGAGRITASAATITSKLTGATAVFSGIVSADGGIRASTVSASSTIGGSNLSGTNTGDQTITLQGDVTGTGTGTFTATIASAAVTTGKMADIPPQTIIANSTLVSAQPKSTSLSSLLDTLSSAQGAVLYRGQASWTAITPGTNGQVLTTGGVSANPTWTSVAGTGTVTSVSGGAGLTFSTNPITAAGDIRLDTSAKNSWTAQQGFAIATLTDASAISWNLTSQQVAQLSRAISGTGQLQDPTNMANGSTYILKVTKASANTATLTFTSAYRWPGSTSPVLTATSGATDIFTFVCVASAMYGSYTQNYTAG